MRICKVWDADYPWDVRVEKVATSLTAAGHDVHLVCRNAGRRPRREAHEGFTIHRLPALPRALDPANALLNFPSPFSPMWIAAVARVVGEIRADLILVRDLPLALPAALVGRIRHVPVVLDMAENYPAMLDDRRRFTSAGIVDRAVRHPAMARAVERLALRLADHVIVVVEESRDRLIRAGVDPARITVVCNTPRPERWARRAEDGAAAGSPHELHLVYLGNLDGSRGIDTAIRAIRHLQDRGRCVRLTAIGGGPSAALFADLAARLNVTDRVTLPGNLPFADVRAIIARADIGLIPHYATDAWNSTIPNKLFDYMLAGLPVVVSDAKPTARIVAAEACGEVFRDRDPLDLAAAVERLEDRARRRLHGLRGRAAVERRYHWAHDAKLLVDAIERVGTGDAAPRAEGVMRRCAG